MRAINLAELPKDLLRARSRFLAWRQRGTADRRIPQTLWTLAVRLVKIHGLSRTSLALGIAYGRLKKHAEAAAANQPPSPAASFVELPAPAVMGKHCLFELHDPAGATLRVQLLGYDTADIETLAHAVWSPE
jgi:hypothetical protein